MFQTSNPFEAFGGFTNQGVKPIENKSKVTFGSEKGTANEMVYQVRVSGHQIKQILIFLPIEETLTILTM